jgi:iron uptake system EfeUOB component EfeO/EfeM
MPNATARRWAPTAIAAVCVALGVFLALTALGVGSHARSARRAPSTLTPLASYSLQAPHVLSGVVVYSLQDLAGGAYATPPPELPPLPVSAFNRPIASYRTYAVAQLGQMEGQIARLEGALAANDRAAAQAAWRGAYTYYLQLGAVYLDGQVALDEEVASLNMAIDGTPGGLPGGVASPRFTGLHRIEYGLWTATAPSALAGFARSLDTDVHRLAQVLPHASLTPLEYATRAHEILEDAARDFLSGMDVPWSGEGVLATDAGLHATEEVIATLHPLLHGEERVIPAVDTELRSLRSAMAALAAAHGGRLPSNGQLTQQQSELLNGTLEGALEALSQVPGVLETTSPPQIPQIPKRDFRVDPIDP